MAQQNSMSGLQQVMHASELDVLNQRLKLDILQNVDFGWWDLNKYDLMELFVIT